MQLLTPQKKNLGPVHLHPKPDKWDYLRSPIMKKKSFLVLTLGNFLEALGSRIGTGSIFCLSFSLSNRVNSFLRKLDLNFKVHLQLTHFSSFGFCRLFPNWIYVGFKLLFHLAYFTSLVYGTLRWSTWFGFCTLGDFKNISTISIFLLAVAPYNFYNFDTKMA